jgi:flagellin-like hook-associated protein FlgL
VYISKASSADSANIAMLRNANAAFERAQKRVATGQAIFSAADDVARHRIASVQISRARQLDTINNSISLALKTVEATSSTLRQMSAILTQAQDLARTAQSEGMPDLRGITSSQDINSASAIVGVAVGARFSITSDNGRNFTFTSEGPGETWGMLVDQLNRSAIGVIADFIPSQTAGQTNIRFYSIDGNDFTFDAITDQAFMDDLASAPWTASASGQTMINAAQANALFSSGGATANGEEGFAVTYGGNIIGTAAVNTLTVLSSGSTISLRDGSGRKRSFVYNGLNQLWQVINDINNSGLAIRAEFTNRTSAGANEQLRLRATDGGEIAIEAATGDFLAGGSVSLLSTGTSVLARPAPLRADQDMKLAVGMQYDSLIANLNQLVQNSPVASGRNLLTGQNMGVIMNEFGGNPLLIRGMQITSNGTLGLTQSGLGWFQFNAIQTSYAQTEQALDILADFEVQVGIFSDYLRNRYEHAERSSVDLRDLGNGLVAADIAEESANMSALQTRQNFAVQAFSISNTTQSGLLRLFG